jgi:hypothetical protein
LNFDTINIFALGADLSLILEIFKPCDFSFDPFFPIQESLGLI